APMVHQRSLPSSPRQPGTCSTNGSLLVKSPLAAESTLRTRSSERRRRSPERACHSRPGGDAAGLAERVSELTAPARAPGTRTDACGRDGGEACALHVNNSLQHCNMDCIYLLGPQLGAYSVSEHPFGRDKRPPEARPRCTAGTHGRRFQSTPKSTTTERANIRGIKNVNSQQCYTLQSTSHCGVAFESVLKKALNCTSLPSWQRASSRDIVKPIC